LVILSARNLRLISSKRKSKKEILNELKKIYQKNRIKGKDFVDFEAALLRLGKDFCRKEKCEMCVAKNFCKR
jgi:endonuclease III